VTQPAGIAPNLHRIRQPAELDAFLNGVLQFFGSRGRFAARAPVDDRHLLGAHAQRHARGIHGGIARAHHGHALSHAHRRVVDRLLVAAHQVHARQEFVGREDAVVCLAGDAHELGRSRAGADEDRVVAHAGDAGW
jgi:hypothetical protein